MVHPDRIFNLKQSSKTGGNIVYWMSRDQRSEDNWALLYARQLAKEFNSEVAVVFCLVDQFLNATIRQYDFMLEGLSEVAQDLQLKNIPFYLRKGHPVNQLSKFIEEHEVTHLITDFDPLRIKKEWRRELAGTVDANIIEIDTHNIVPARIASNKQEFAAYTFRPKIQKNKC